MNKKVFYGKILFLMAFLLCGSMNVFSQNFDIKEVFINNKEENCFGFSDRYYEGSDTLNYYVVIESACHNDKIIVCDGKEEVFNETVTSDGTHGFAKKILVGGVDEVEVISIKINDNPTIKFSTGKGKYYYRVYFSKYSETLEVCFSKYLPYYR